MSKNLFDEPHDNSRCGQLGACSLGTLMSVLRKTTSTTYPTLVDVGIDCDCGLQITVSMPVGATVHCPDCLRLKGFAVRREER